MVVALEMGRGSAIASGAMPEMNRVVFALVFVEEYLDSCFPG